MSCWANAARHERPRGVWLHEADLLGKGRSGRYLGLGAERGGWEELVPGALRSGWACPVLAQRPRPRTARALQQQTCPPPPCVPPPPRSGQAITTHFLPAPPVGAVTGDHPAHHPAWRAPSQETLA